MFGFSSRDEHFEGIILNARKKLEFCMEPLCGHSPRLIWAPWRLSHCLICIQICFWSQILFLVDPCTNYFWLKIQFLLSAPRHLGFRSVFKKIFAHRKTSTKPRQREQHKHHDKESLSMILWGSMLFELACAFKRARQEAHNEEYKRARGQSETLPCPHLAKLAEHVFVRSTWTRGQDLRAGTPKPLANVLCRLAKKFGKSVHHT